MHRRVGGILAASALAIAGCGAGDVAEQATPTITAPEVLAASLQPPVTAPSTGERVIVASRAGATSPGLDAAMTTLLARPDLALEAWAPGGSIDEGAEMTTMTGLPVEVVPGDLAAALDAALAAGPTPALVVLGIDVGAPIGAARHEDPTVAQAQRLSASGIPVIVVQAGGPGPDLAGASRALIDALDRVDASGPADALVVTVPACPTGTIRGMAEVRATDRSLPGAVVCTGPASTPDTDVEAYGSGWITLVDAG